MGSSAMKTRSVVMNHQKAIFCICLVSALFASIAMGLQHRDQIKHLVVFGNSFSDNGNTYAASGDTYPGLPYFRGRFSDGLTWPAYFAKRLHLDIDQSEAFNNFAYGQAQIKGVIPLKTYYPSYPDKQWSFSVPDLSGQIDQYLKKTPQAIEMSLFVLFMGANDFLNYVPHSEKNDQDFALHRAKVFTYQIGRLKKQGAKRIIAFTIRRLQSSPLARQLARQHGDQYMEKLSKMISVFNQYVIKQYEDDDQVWVYDVYAFDQKLQSKPKQYRWQGKTYLMSNMSDPCYLNHGNYIDQTSDVCKNPQQYFYFDRIHPTTYAHGLMAEDLYQSWQAAG
jgi:phospholipase/lecithinase/hemolysin